MIGFRSGRGRGVSAVLWSGAVLAYGALACGGTAAFADAGTGVSAGASADDGVRPAWTAGAFGVVGKPGALGGEAAFWAQFKPFSDSALYVGPRVGMLVAFADDDRTRWDTYVGVSETLWVVNAVGSGLDLDAVILSRITGEDSSAVHFRVTPYLAIRFLGWGREGAVALRLGIPYDTHYKWGIQAGLALQLNGVTRLGVD